MFQLNIFGDPIELRPRNHGAERYNLTPEQRLRVEQNERLILSFASRRAHKYWPITPDDVLSYAGEGLWKAARSFEPGRGNKFSTYAYAAMHRTCSVAASRGSGEPAVLSIDREHMRHGGMKTMLGLREAAERDEAGMFAEREELEWETVLQVLEGAA